MPFPKNLKNPIRFGVFLFAVSFLGCASVRTSFVRPSSGESGNFDAASSGAVRASHNRQRERDKAQRPSTAKKDTDKNKNKAQNQRARQTDAENEPLAPVPFVPEREPTKRGAAIRRAAERYLGVPYRFGGISDRGFDCSGFVWRVFQDVGYTDFVRTNAQTMFDTGRPIDQNALKNGDLVFFYDPQNRRRIGHVGIYISPQRFIHASSSGGIIYSDIDDSYWRRFFAGYRRVLP